MRRDNLHTYTNLHKKNIENLCRHVKDRSARHGVDDLSCMVNPDRGPLTSSLHHGVTSESVEEPVMFYFWDAQFQL